MSDTDMIMESLEAVGSAILSEVTKGKKHFNPEANRYSRAFNIDILCRMLARGLTQTSIFVLMSIIRAMDSDNKTGGKYITSLGIPRVSLHRAMKELTDYGLLYKFKDGNIMINPSLVVLTKFKGNCLGLQDKWKQSGGIVIQAEAKLN
jgi:hypothetical protein